MIIGLGLGLGSGKLAHPLEPKIIRKLPGKKHQCRAVKTMRGGKIHRVGKI